MKAEVKGGPKKRIYSNFDYVEYDGNNYRISNDFSKLLENSKLKKEILDVIEYAIHNWTVLRLYMDIRQKLPQKNIPVQFL